MYKKMEIADTPELLENDSTEHCSGLYFGIHITAKGAKDKKRRYFTSHSAVKDFNNQVLRKTRYRVGASWSLTISLDCTEDVSSIVPMDLKTHGTTN